MSLLSSCDYFFSFFTSICSSLIPENFAFLWNSQANANANINCFVMPFFAVMVSAIKVPQTWYTLAHAITSTVTLPLPPPKKKNAIISLSQLLS